MNSLTFPPHDLILDPEPLPPTLGNCLVCGQSNRYGIRVRFHRLLGPDGTPVGVGALSGVPTYFQGFDDVVHGGAICALLDDAMWWAVFAAHGVVTVTADLQLRFRAPIPISNVLRIEGVAGPGRRIYGAASRLLDGDRRVLAEATGRFVTTALAQPESAGP